MANIKLLPIEEIKRLYYQEELPIYEIAKRVGYHRQTISKKLLAAGYTLRSRKHALSVAYKQGRKTTVFTRKRKDITDEIVKKLYCNEKLSAPQIAKQFNCSPTLIYYRLWEMGIQTRTAGESNRIIFQRRLRCVNGKNNPSWKGGRYIDQKTGYIYVYAPDFAKGKQSYISEHVLVWEQTHKKPVPKGYVVHHINGIKTDNRPSNLVALPKKKHESYTLLHKAQQKIRELEIENRQLQRALENSQMIFYISEN